MSRYLLRFRAKIKRNHGIFASILAWLSFVPLAFAQQIPAKVLQEDFQIMRSALEQAHGGIYRYSSKAEMDRTFNRAYRQINYPMTDLEFWRLAAPVAAHIKCGHTFLWLPEAERKKMLALSFDEFDQTDGSGFRFLLDQKRHVEAAELIEAYISRNRRNSTERELVSLHFHAGQLYGIVGDASKAVPHLKKARYKGEPTPDSHPLYWNAYVDATSAFIRGDQRGVIEARRRMGAMNHGFHRLVDSFIENFEEPYADLIFGQKMKKLPEEEN